MNQIVAAHPEFDSVQKILQSDLFVVSNGDKIAIFSEEGFLFTHFELDNYAEPLGEIAEVFAEDKERPIILLGVYIKPFFDEISEH